MKNRDLSNFCCIFVQLFTEFMEKNVFVVCDRSVEKLASELAPDRPHLSITADEDHKNMDSVLSICRWLLSEGADRNALVYAVGGGVTTDMVGFAASIYKRGVRYINYPTTLLSQVDAGIGGKTGVNLDSYKNMIGVINFPAETRILAKSLDTLPDRELRSGAAELLKSFIIDNRDGNYSKAVELLSCDKPDSEALAPLIKAAGDVKRRIVEQDPYEHGQRRLLNLDHTYAHAIEWYQHVNPCANPMSHGEAVAVGMIKAAGISERLGVAGPGLSDRLRSDFLACRLPVDFPCPEEKLESAIWKDKKAENGKIHFILIKEIGNVIIKDLDDLHQY